MIPLIALSIDCKNHLLNLAVRFEASLLQECRARLELE